LAGNLILVSYISKFPLFSAKYLDSKDWTKTVLMMENKLHLTEDGKAEFTAIKAQMKDSRTILVWDHLQNFYDLRS
jgi:hypothetical protein